MWQPSQGAIKAVRSCRKDPSRVCAKGLPQKVPALEANAAFGKNYGTGEVSARQTERDRERDRQRQREREGGRELETDRWMVCVEALQNQRAAFLSVSAGQTAFSPDIVTGCQLDPGMRCLVKAIQPSFVASEGSSILFMNLPRF